MSRILIVEDEEVLRLTFKKFLNDEGYDVETANGYDDAVSSLESETFDVVVTDIVLGGKTGVDLLRTIQQEDIRCEVLMITGDPSVETASEAVRLGAFDYLAKPVTGPDLTRVIRLALDRRALAVERDLYAARADQTRRELQTIFNSVHEGIITVDAALEVGYVNSAAYSVFGLDEQAPSGQRLSALLTGELEPARSALEHTIATGEAVSDLRLETSADGGETKVLIVNTAPLLDVGGAVLVARDLTRLTTLERRLEGSRGYGNIVGASDNMRQIFDLIEDLKDTDSTVLICGESGTGKERIAEALQSTSPRANGPYVKVNCAALSDDVLESELFGHVKGAFTGAIKDRTGRFEAADRGTILLDEIGDISPRLQLRLLRVLQEREFERLGDSKPIKVNVRVIATSNRNLLKKIESGEFRQDLYYRLNVFRIEVPPLREHPEDIPVLVDHFRNQLNQRLKKEITGVSPEVMERFMHYPWAGNVRELENCLERAFIVCRDPHILIDHLPPEVRDHEVSTVESAIPQAKGGRHLNRESIEDVLQQTDWNIAKTAKKLGVARNTLYQKIRTFGLSRPAD